MIILNIDLNNFYNFKNFHMNLACPEDISNSQVGYVSLPDRPNFLYKSVNIIIGDNGTGKTAFGNIITAIFNFINSKNYDFITSGISDKNENAYFSIDVVGKNNILYRITCTISYDNNVDAHVYKENILSDDSYFSCIDRLEGSKDLSNTNYIFELDKVERFNTFFNYFEDQNNILHLPNKDENFCFILNNILKYLDPSIKDVITSKEIERCYIIQTNRSKVILQDREELTTNCLSSGAKEGVYVAKMLYCMIYGNYDFFYCDNFPYISNNNEEYLLLAMINCIKQGKQLFFTTRNYNILKLDLPRNYFNLFCLNKMKYRDYEWLKMLNNN